MKKIALVSLLVLLLANLGFAQNENKKEGKINFTLHLRNGDIISGSTKIRTLIVNMPYGSLALPLANIQHIKMGVNNPNLDKEYIIKMAERLRSSDPDDQKLAFNGLCSLEAGGISVLKEYMQSESYVTVSNSEYTVPAAINILQIKYNIDEQSPLNDIISFDDVYTIEGTCNLTDKVELESAFGLLQISRNDIVTIDVSAEITESEATTKQFIIQANKNISGNVDGGFFNTGIQIKAGKNFQIAANGKVTLASLSGNTYTADGGINGAPAPNDGGTNAPTYGSLVFKIGENGMVIKAGTLYKGKAVESGNLYLAIYETVFNPNNSGNYKVKIKAE